MRTKKIMSLLVATFMLLSMMAMPAFAEAACTMSITGADMAKYGETYVVDVNVNSNGAKLRGVGFILTYDSTLFDYTSFEVSQAPDGDTSVTKLEEGKLECVSAGHNDVFDAVWAKLTFTAKAGTENAEASFQAAFDTTETVAFLNAEGDVMAAAEVDFGTALDVPVKVAHVAPSITGVTLDPATGSVKAAITAVPAGWSDNWDIAPGYEYAWTVGGEAADETTATYTPSEDDLGKEVKVVVTPVAAGIKDATAKGASKEAAVTIVPEEGYEPKVTKLEITKITAGKTPEVEVVIDKYAKLDDATEYAWYVVADAADEDAAIAAIKDAGEKPAAIDTELLTEKLTKDYKGQYAVLEVIAKAKLGDTPYTASAAEYAAAEIKVKKSGGSAQTGASLVTGGNVTVKPEEPEKPEDPEVPTEPEKDPEDPAGTANDKGAAAFTDVDKEAYAWAYDSIDTLAKAGVIKGMTETTFGPELTTTNAQVIALAVRIAGLTAEEGATTDKVDAEHWVAGEMAIADANEILAVFGDKVDVEGETTREIAFTLLYNALKAAGVELPETAEAIEYTDAASISEGCVEAIEALTKAGIVNGMGDGTLAPKATITRAQLAKILGLAEALIK